VRVINFIKVEYNPDTIRTSAQEDPIIGKPLQLMGHYNPYTQGTINAARIVDADMASNFTSNIVAGKMQLGGDVDIVSQPVDLGFIGDILPAYHGMSMLHITAQMLTFTKGARNLWFANIPYESDINAPDYMGSAVFQFVVSKAHIKWGDKGASHAINTMRELCASSDVQGLVVRYALYSITRWQSTNAQLTLTTRFGIGCWCCFTEHNRHDRNLAHNRIADSKCRSLISTQNRGKNSLPY
jgi:hypothetical protein